MPDRFGGLFSAVRKGQETLNSCSCGPTDLPMFSMKKIAAVVWFSYIMTRKPTEGWLHSLFNVPGSILYLGWFFGQAFLKHYYTNKQLYFLDEDEKKEKWTKENSQWQAQKKTLAFLWWQPSVWTGQEELLNKKHMLCMKNGSRRREPDNLMWSKLSSSTENNAQWRTWFCIFSSSGKLWKEEKAWWTEGQTAWHGVKQTKDRHGAKGQANSGRKRKRTSLLSLRQTGTALRGKDGRRTKASRQWL